MQRKPTVPDHDYSDSAVVPRPLTRLLSLDHLEQAHHDGALEVIQAVAAALAEAVDLAHPYTTTGRALTVSSLVSAAANTGDVDQLLAGFRQLVTSWKAGA